MYRISQEFLRNDIHISKQVMANWMIQCADRYLGSLYEHARRPFAEALKALPKDKKESARETIAYQTIKQIAAIYHLDNELSDLSPHERQKMRQITIKPLVEAFFAWAKGIKDSSQLSKGKTLDGISYCINHEDNLKVFLDDGEVPMDSNATEGALRSFCLHKHTWKLIDTIEGAKSNAIIYSITETAKANNLNPFRYLEYVLSEIMEHQEDKDQGFLDNLLPWSVKLPEYTEAKQQSKNSKPSRHC